MRSETRGSWLCPTDLDRSRAADANESVRNVRLVGIAFVGLALVACGPWVGWWVLIPFAFTAANLITVERRLVRSAHPERVSAWAMVTTLLTIAGGVVFSGGPHSPALPWMVLPVGISAARFRPKVVNAGVALTVIAILLATLGAHPLQTVRYPVLTMSTLALLAGMISIVRALETAELHHRDEAILDPLTGLLNRNALMRRFIELAHQAQLTGQPVCLVMCDVDGFKNINDRYGHGRGDAVLRDIAYELRKRLRSFELVYRLGGEEFLILLPGIDLAAGSEVAERLRISIEQARPTGLPVTISLGLSAGRGEEVDYETLFGDADEALYRAKREGRNRVVAAPASPGEAQAQPHSPSVRGSEDSGPAAEAAGWVVQAGAARGRAAAHPAPAAPAVAACA
jgi:diguanylate cyclase (GGDEF)-like protein